MTPSLPSRSTRHLPDATILRARKALEAVEQFGIRLQGDDAIFVGSLVLEAHGLRVARDVDLILRPRLRASLAVRGTFDAGEGVQILQDPYRSLGIADSACFDRELYSELVADDGFIVRVALPELEFGKKIFRQREKDVADVLLLQRIARNSPSWDWSLIPESPATPRPQTSPRRLIPENSRRNLIKIARVLQSSRTPIGLLRVASRVFKRHVRHSQRPIEPGSMITKMVDVGTLVQWQVRDGGFTRYDILVRLQAVRRLRASLLDLSTPNAQEIVWQRAALSDYRFMQQQRVGRDTDVRFLELLRSVGEAGFHVDRYPIRLAASGALLDGSHRLAIAIADGVEQLPVVFSRQRTGARPYDRAWFRNNGFDLTTLEVLDRERDQILESTGAAFQMILWPPVQSFAEDIVSMMEIRFNILRVTRQVEIKDFPAFVRRVYLSDDIEPWKIEKKLFHMSDVGSTITTVAFQIDRPNYRRKNRTGSYLSAGAAELKREIRDLYRGEIGNYFHDIIVHVGDNPAMNRDVVRAIKEDGKR